MLSSWRRSGRITVVKICVLCLQRYFKVMGVVRRRGGNYKVGWKENSRSGPATRSGHLASQTLLYHQYCGYRCSVDVV